MVGGKKAAWAHTSPTDTAFGAPESSEDGKITALVAVFAAWQGSESLNSPQQDAR